MPITTVNGVGLYWERRGDTGPPLVLVHGSWGDHGNWDRVLPSLARAFRVLTYDRRGHSRSERPAAQGSIDEDVADLAELIAAQDLAPAHVAGNSFGGIVALRLAAARPDLFASLIVHEPPLLGMLQGHPMLPPIAERLEAVVAALRSGDQERGAREFVDRVALGPGSWERLSPEARRTFVFNGPTFLDEAGDPASLMAPDLERLSVFPHPALVTRGDRSPAFFSLIADRIAAALPGARRHTFRGAGHIPQTTHPDDYVAVVSSFIASVPIPW